MLSKLHQGRVSFDRPRMRDSESGIGARGNKDAPHAELVEARKTPVQDESITEPTLFQIRELDVKFATPDGEVHAVKGVSLAVNASECLGVVGESGSGKSQLFLASLGLLAANGRAAGSVRFRGQDILGSDERALNRLRGSHITMVFQDPRTSLTPHLTVGA